MSTVRNSDVPLPASVSESELAQTIRSASQQWCDAVNSGDIEQVLRIVSDDVEFMPPGQAAVAGAAAHNFLRALLGGFRLRVSPYTNEQIEVAGDWAFQRYSYELALTPRAGGESMVQRGDGIHIWRRDANGAWRVAKDVFTAVG